MTFEELLDHAIDMLRRRGRVTYRALKLQFHLDDDTLDVLKDELIYGQQLAVDEEGRVLMWAGPPGNAPSCQPPTGCDICRKHPDSRCGPRLARSRRRTPAAHRAVL